MVDSGVVRDALIYKTWMGSWLCKALMYVLLGEEGGVLGVGVTLWVCGTYGWVCWRSGVR